ncbi:MAG TPA: RsmE family RNA methyltransferase [Candidatus Binatia bacterium]|nr:RsmE family RNA methyltransferase [Candidatus Binatia bacterium]
MPRLFVDRQQLSGGTLVLEGSQARHLAGSLRVRPGELIEVVDDAGSEHGVRVTGVGRGRVTGSVLWTREAGGEPRLHLEVVQALIRELDEVVAGLTEVGVGVIRPAVTARCVTRPDGERAAGRLRRWREIAREAAQLAHRAAVPPVHPVTDLGTALAELPEGSRILGCVVDAPRSLAGTEVDAGRPLALVVGPEGGLDASDLEALRSAGAELVHLGPRILPSARAGVVAAALILAASGDLTAGPPGSPER